MANTKVSKTPAIWAIVPAAGIGNRMQASVPKQYLKIQDRYLIDITLNKLLHIPHIKGIVVALSEHDENWPKLSHKKHPKIHTVTGGKERRDSVYNGLEFCLAKDDNIWALVHDAARPCVSVEKINQLIASCIDGASTTKSDGAILAVPCADTVKRVLPETQHIKMTEDRAHLWLAHTPQCFPASLLKRALAFTEKNHMTVTDEASAIEAMGGEVHIVPDRRDNIKVTLPEDLLWAETILKQQGMLP